MSWWETLANGAKTVLKALGDATRSDTRLGASYALPYGKRRNIYGTSGNADSDSDDEDDDDNAGEGTSQEAAARITTRARITYELDRFQKNAMLMFVQILSDPPNGNRAEDHTMNEVSELIETFTKFRFEVDTHMNLSCGEVDNKCQEFFQRDFQQYGAVVVIVLSFHGRQGQLSALDGRFSESIITRHFTYELNPSLIGKPKIYITEASRTVSTTGQEPEYSLSIEEHYQDILGLHMPALSSDGVLPPLLILCDCVNRMADSIDFASILKKFIDETTAMYSENGTMIPIQLSSTLAKEIRLARS